MANVMQLWHKCQLPTLMMNQIHLTKKVQLLLVPGSGNDGIGEITAGLPFSNTVQACLLDFSAGDPNVLDAVFFDAVFRCLFSTGKD
ncbi:hypothetical protein KIL84_005477 [Mauremys mutica]|uniref:Uncharacterized protein n=1 Tax=Mauremys mutica TaxID=74926 RepID=A0A9D3XL04_9SAUR|nr:hypothetical protein KIL84_005477 [Mauremys mutica]